MSTETRRHRENTEISMEILEKLLFNNLEMLPTNLMQITNLTHVRLSEQIKKFVRLGYVQIIERKIDKPTSKFHKFYRITPKGINMYIDYRIFKNKLEESKKV